MSTTLFAINVILSSREAPHITSEDDAWEIFKSAEAEELPSVLGMSRNGWLIWAVGKLAELAGASSAVRLCGSGAGSICVEGEWSQWHYALIEGEQLDAVAASIDQLFDWSRSHLDELARDDFLGFFASIDEIRQAILEPTESSNPCADAGIAYSEDGDGPWVLYSYLFSIKELIKVAKGKSQCLLVLNQQ